jgi:hypothetical protein
MGFEPGRADRPVVASESSGFAAGGLPLPHPGNQSPQRSSNRSLTGSFLDENGIPFLTDHPPSIVPASSGGPGRTRADPGGPGRTRADTEIAR